MPWSATLNATSARTPLPAAFFTSRFTVTVSPGRYSVLFGAAVTASFRSSAFTESLIYPTLNDGRPTSASGVRAAESTRPCRRITETKTFGRCFERMGISMLTALPTSVVVYRSRMPSRSKLTSAVARSYGDLTRIRADSPGR